LRDPGYAIGVRAVSVQIETRLREYMLAVAFDVERELLALVGRAGAGKSIVLRSIAGVFVPDSGTIWIGDRAVFSSGLGIDVPPAERYVGFVPQTHALFPHLSVAGNVAFPLRKRSADQRIDVDRRVTEIMELLGLLPLAPRFPEDLTDLEQQRVAVARALVIDPDVLLMDDPFASLDIGTRRRAQDELHELRRQIGIPLIFATTELEEALELADRAALIDRGQLLQVDPPDRILNRPANRRAAEVVGAVNIVPGEVVREQDGRVEVHTALSRLTVADTSGVRGHVDVVVRPEHIRVFSASADSGEPVNQMSGVVTSCARLGALHVLAFEPDGAPQGTQLQITLSDLAFQQAGIAAGQRCVIALPADHIHLMRRPPTFEEFGVAQA
jgi:ABC-type Fe3+/spermidine/putrescine transport system ATPase subunit